MIKILLIFFIPIIGFAQGLKPDVFSIPNLPYLKIQDSMDSICYYNLRSYSLDKSLYIKDCWHEMVADSDAKAVLIDDLDTMRPDFQEILRDAKNYVTRSFNNVVMCDSSNRKVDSFNFIFEEYSYKWLTDYLLINNSINHFWPAFKNRTGIIFYNIRNKKFQKYSARNLKCVGQNNNEVFFVIDSAGFIEHFSANPSDILKLGPDGFTNITGWIRNKYFSKISANNMNVDDNLTKYIEYFDGNNIIFDNDTSSYQFKTNRLQKIKSLPNKFTFIKDSIFSFDEYHKNQTPIIINNNISVILSKKSGHVHCSNLYILDENGLSEFLKLSDLIYFESNRPNIVKVCHGEIIYLDPDYAIIKLWGFFLIPNTELIIVDLKKHKIIAAPKLIYKDNFPL